MKDKKENKQSNFIIYVSVALLCSLAFISIYGVRVINPRYTDWLLTGGDLSQHYLGWVAYRMSEWKFPIGMFDPLSYPHNASIIFTDSIPICAVIFKILSPILPKTFQYFGIWGLICFILQGILGAKIIRNFTDKKVAVIICGFLFAFTPIMLQRMFGHTALAGQWVLLLLIEPLLSPSKYKDNKKIYLLSGIVGLLSGSIHMYFILMNGIILTGICLQDLITNKRIKRSLLLLAIFISSSTLTTILLGGFSSGMKAGIWGLGYYSMNLNSFFNAGGWSRIIKPLQSYTDGQFEGFAYLGLGFAFLLICSIIAFIIHKDFRKDLKENIKNIIAVVLVCLTSLMISLSPTVTFGNKKLFEIKIPSKLDSLWSVFRSSGRLCWGVVYIIMLLACICTVKYFKTKAAVILLIIALSVQLFDISSSLSWRFNHFNSVQKYDYDLNQEEIWQQLSKNNDIKHIIYCYPIPTDDRSFMFALTLWGLKENKTFNNYYFARSIDEQAEETKKNALGNPSKEELFIFDKNLSAECGKYDLNYYEIPEGIIGYVDEIPGEEAADYDFKNVWEFGDNRYLAGHGEDTYEGRLLYPEARSYGPYWSIPKGSYTVNINGENLSDKTEIVIYSDKGKTHNEYTIFDSNESAIICSFDLNTDVSDLEISVKNVGDESILLHNIEIRYDR